MARCQKQTGAIMNKLIDIILNFITKTIGTTLTVIIVVFVLGVYIALSYPLGNYVVTPDTLQKKVDSVYTKMDKSTAKSKIDIIEMQLDNLRREKSDLEDKMDVKPKTRYLIRLQDVNKYIDKLEKNKKESMNVLETK
jgi:hypothetical protein